LLRLLNIVLLLLAAIFALLFIAAFMPGAEGEVKKSFLWIGNSGLIICLCIILLIRRKNTRF